VLGMFSSFPAAWVLVALPFLSALLISQIRPLRALAATRYRVTWPLGIAGLVLLFAELIGALPAASALPVMLLAGAVSGFSLFWPLRDQDSPGSGEGGWSGEGPPRDGPPGDDGPPLTPLGHRWPDWERFDRLRAEWEPRSSRPRPPTRNT
jgi:hypothetical protein